MTHASTKPATRRLAALGAAAAVTGALVPLGGVTPAGAAPRPVTRAAAPAAPSAPAQVAPGCRTDDGVVVSAAPIAWNGLETGTVILWYSPSSRCAWASAVPSYSGFNSRVELRRSDHVAFPSATDPAGGKVVSPVASDAGYLAAGYAEISFVYGPFGVITATGKTGVY